MTHTAATTTDFEQIGRSAFCNGESCYPMASAAIAQAVADLPVGAGAAGIFRAFTKGWEAESFAAAFAAIED